MAEHCQVWGRAGFLLTRWIACATKRLSRSDVAKMITPNAVAALSQATAEQQQQAREAVAAAKSFQAELFAHRGGVPFPDAADLINQLRDERTREIERY